MSTRLSEMNLPRFPLLSDKEMKELLIKAKNGDQAAREKLVNCNLKLVFNLVQRFCNRGYEPEDLFQIGTIGLIKAIDKFDLSYDVKFSTYAVPLIIGEIRRFLRDDNPVKVSRSVKETANKINRAREKLSASLGRDPTISEIAKEVGMEREEIVNAMEASQLPTSIYETLYQDDGDPIYVMDAITGSSGDEGQWFEHMALKDVLQKLPEREKKVLLLRFFEDKTQTQVAEILGISQVQVSRIERQALKTIRSMIGLNDRN
ncbi:FliA/WhiG subfamily RNA polymerase sigma-28 subunit [Thermincola ferriacetica]|uniref:RNA polymerase sigma factor n=2 Tax=Thermincola TaxID=278993 RepID=D5X7D5_THEPJ|nr:MULTISPECIES: RNA polymerase sporulation sigma factor SigF [Thermincola]ADG82505.1 RNA polymerase, sigma 28 subunit, FliA/WhiG subfamily [Thermincola potens JR]KNZ70783.1 FliA/WhiG subfamily RNA polymerase sigma-28 subunit [Thermincola ferriacetica]